jgi:chemotaxis protein histidine kinase CheA
MNQKDIASKVFVYLKLIREVDLFRYGKSYIAVTAGLFTYSSSQEGYIPAKMYGPRAQLLAYFKPEDEIIIEGYFTKINDEYEIIIEAVSSFRLDKIDRKKGQERLEKAAKVKARFPDVVCLLRSEADPLKRQIPRIENTDIELSQVSLSDEWVILGTPRLNPEDLLYATYYYQVDVGYEEQVEDDVSEQECEQELEKASKQEQVDQEESNEESNYELIKLLQSLEESEQELEKASKQEQVNQEESNQELLQSLGESELQLEKEQVNQEEFNQELLQSLGEPELQLEKEQVNQEQINQEESNQEEFNQELLQSLGESELQLEKEQVNQEESNEESNQEQVKEQESDPEEAERRKFLEEKQKLLEQFFLIFQLIDFHMYEEEMSRPKKELLDDLFEEDFQIYYNGGWHKLT